MLKDLRFDAGIVGGHTIVLSSGMRSHAKYEIMRSIIDGPLVMSPISISKLSFESGARETLKGE
jgi:hypothetical protein